MSSYRAIFDAFARWDSHASEEAKERFRDLRTNPPEEGNAAETTIAEIDPDPSRGLFSEFDFGDDWEHHKEFREIRAGSRDGDPAVVDRESAAPPQYPEQED